MNSNDGLGAYGHVSRSEDMSLSLVAPSPEEVAVPATAIPMIEVVAPATLREGYRLDAEVGDRLMTVTIPMGGVEKGQKFWVPLSPQDSAASGAIPAVQKMSVPVGGWKDGLCSCCRYGMCHAHLCISFWCHALAAGQVISRLQLNWLGKTTDSRAQKAQAFATLFTISMVYFATKMLIDVIFTFQPPDAHNAPLWIKPLVVLDYVAVYAYYFLSIIVIYNLRSFIRSKYAIPEHDACPKGCEDACVAVCCPCCGVAQMMRHTTEYETYRAECFSATGLPDHVPALLV